MADTLTMLKVTVQGKYTGFGAIDITADLSLGGWYRPRDGG